MKFLFLEGKTVREICNGMSVTLNKKFSYSSVKNWVAWFTTGCWSTEDDRPGRPLVVSVPENVDAIHSIILAERRISAKNIAETVEISWECVGFIVHDMLDMKLPEKWVPSVWMWIRSVIVLWLHRRFLSTLDRTQQVSWFDLWQWMNWINLYDPETQEQSKEWRNSFSPHPKNFRHLKTASKVIAYVFWDKDGILLVYYLKKGTTITESSSVLGKVKQALVSKWRRNLSKVVLFLQDTASWHTAAITQQKLADLHFKVLKHPACSPDFWLPFVPKLEKTSEVNEIFKHWGCHVCCRRLFCSPTFRILCGWHKEVGAVNKRCVKLRQEFVE